MAKKARPKRAARKKAPTSPAVNSAPAVKKAVRKNKPSSKKGAAKKEKKAKHAALEKQVIAAVEQFHKETTMLGAYARQFFDSLRKSGIDLPAKSRKALGASARDLRKAARSLKKLADS